MRMLVLGFIGLCAWCNLHNSARADLAPIPQPKEVKVVFVVEENAKANSIIVPQGLTRQRIPIRPRPQPGPGAAPGGVPKGEEEAMLDVTEDVSSFAVADDQPKSHTWVAGVALAMSAGFGGLWLVRKNAGGMRKFALLIAVGSALTASAMVWGNGAPFPQKREPKVLGEIKAELDQPAVGEQIVIVLDLATAKAMFGHKK